MGKEAEGFNQFQRDLARIISQARAENDEATFVERELAIVKAHIAAGNAPMAAHAARMLTSAALGNHWEPPQLSERERFERSDA